jgi:hypothetical protein
MPQMTQMIRRQGAAGRRSVLRPYNARRREGGEAAGSRGASRRARTAVQSLDSIQVRRYNQCMDMFPHIQEEFVVVRADLERVEAVMTERTLMERWMSPAVRFQPVDTWSFAQGARWRLQLTGLGRLIEATYIVYERRPGLILWAFDGFWEGFDAWQWMPMTGQPGTLIQNRIEYAIRIPGLAQLWPATLGPLMGWDARVQMERLREVCEATGVRSQASEIRRQESGVA